MTSLRICWVYEGRLKVNPLEPLNGGEEVQEKFSINIGIEYSPMFTWDIINYTLFSIILLVPSSVPTRQIDFAISPCNCYRAAAISTSQGLHKENLQSPVIDLFITYWERSFTRQSPNPVAHFNTAQIRQELKRLLLKSSRYGPSLNHNVMSITALYYIAMLGEAALR